ncbi:MAG TPA: hypothetical protein VGG16_18100 [Streptosporangiaceae bacterium]
MSIRSWFFRRSRRSSRSSGETPRRSLLRNQRDDPKLRRIQQAAAEDIAAIRQDDQYFDPNSPGNQEPY